MVTAKVSVHVRLYVRPVFDHSGIGSAEEAEVSGIETLAGSATPSTGGSRSLPDWFFWSWSACVSLTGILAGLSLIGFQVFVSVPSDASDSVVEWLLSSEAGTTFWESPFRRYTGLTGTVLLVMSSYVAYATRLLKDFANAGIGARVLATMYVLVFVVPGTAVWLAFWGAAAYVGLYGVIIGFLVAIPLGIAFLVIALPIMGIGRLVEWWRTGD